jgi:hypothetical protein
MMANTSRLSRKLGARSSIAIVSGTVFALVAVSPGRGNADPEKSDHHRSALAVGAAIVPGLVIHGSGHVVAGDAATGSRLLALEGAGLGTMALGFVPIVLTGASRRLVGPGVALTIVGSGLFMFSALADLYGVVAPPGGFGEPPHAAPLLATEVGYRYVYDPVFAYRNFVFYEVDYRTGPLRVHPSAWFALENSTSRLRAPLAFRWIGPRPSPAPPSPDGSYLDIEAAVTRHADLADRFITTTGEVSVMGRLDMRRFAKSLTGSFAEMGLGWALQSYHYQVKGASTDVGELLLGRLGYGMYVGWPGTARGEVMLYYDHRHDDFAAGLKIPGIGSGVAGHFGISGRIFVSDHWGVAAEAIAGSAYVAGLSFLFRQGERL